MWRDIDNTDSPDHGIRLRLAANYREDQILFCWYLYNRGGVCNAHTVQAFFDLSSTDSVYRQRNRLIQAGAITPLFQKSVFRARHQAQLYRLSNTFLTDIEQRDSNIRKIRRLDQAIQSLTLAHFFLQPEYRGWRLVNRDARKAYLLDTLSVPESDLPTYWVGAGNKSQGVVSINHEIVVDPAAQHYVVFHHQGTTSLAVDFERRFLLKWAGVFNAQDIHAMPIATSDVEDQYFHSFMPPEPLSPSSVETDRIKRMIAVAQGQVLHTSPGSSDAGIQRPSFRIRVAPFRDIRERYSA